jgi:halogenation protein CepH
MTNGRYPNKAMIDKANGDYDVIVVGGGPGGSTVSTLVAMQGHRVVLLERERFPRYQIGESLLPTTVHGICRLLGVTNELARMGFPIKRGGTFRWGASPEPWTFSFARSPKFPGATSTTYQVERSKFDAVLLDNARRHGVEVREKCAVVDVIKEDGRVTGVVYADATGDVRRELHARYVVDASGNTSRIHNAVGGQRRYSPLFRNLALFAYFEGGKRLPAPNQGNILSVAFGTGWFWYIPLSDTLTSVGAVLHHDALDRVRGDREQALLTLISECPLIAEYLADAHRVTDGMYGKVRVRKDYSYSQEKFWYPGMVLIGDAACFIDPIFSNGVHLATYSGLIAARSINTCLRDELDEVRCFGEFEGRYRREYDLFHDFLATFYDMHQDQEAYFRNAKEIINSATSGIESFVELVGGGASNESALVKVEKYLAKRRSVLREFSMDIESPGARQEGGQPSAYRATILEQRARNRVQAALGKKVDEPKPLLPGGLIPSTDGMRWALVA